MPVGDFALSGLLVRSPKQSRLNLKEIGAPTEQLSRHPIAAELQHSVFCTVHNNTQGVPFHTLIP